MTLTEEQIDYEKKLHDAILEQKRKELEKVAPKFEEWRNHYTYKIAEGGRGAGSKSWSCASLLIQKYTKSQKQLQCLCVREFMNSLAESSYNLLVKTINRLGYGPIWEITKEYIKNRVTGSYFIFRGLRDLRTAEQLKSYEGFDDLFADEAAGISMESWEIIVPTLRKADKEIWVVYNRDQDLDPCHEYFVVNRRPNTSYLHLEPGPIDNPWWDQTSLPEDMEADYKRDPDRAEHIWKGLPKKQGTRSAISRVLIREAMDRILDDDDNGIIQVGIDVARFGDDRTVMYKRKGMKVIDSLELKSMDTNQVTYESWNFVGQDSSVPILIDVGYNPGVADRLEELGAWVIQVNFGGVAENPDKYDSMASEMWFEFPIGEADIPNDQELMNELSGRLYDYDKKGRKMIESKKKFKERYGYSPDKADALLLCFLTSPLNNGGRVADWSLSELGL